MIPCKEIDCEYVVCLLSKRPLWNGGIFTKKEGTPDALKGARPVWAGGKGRDESQSLTYRYILFISPPDRLTFYAGCGKGVDDIALENKIQSQRNDHGDDGYGHGNGKFGAALSADVHLERQGKRVVFLAL